MGAANFTSQVDHAFYFILAISATLLIVITVLMVYFVIRYHHSRHPKAKDIPGNVLLEVTWTVVPFFLVMAMFYFGVVSYDKMRHPPKKGFHVQVTARMWSWMFTYDNGLQTDTLYVPTDEPVILSLKSLDVIHSFYVPAFRIKQDVVPGLKNKLWFKVNEPGRYFVQCAEYCGDRHSYMITKVVALPRAQFEAWYANASKKMAAVAPASAKKPAAPSTAEMAVERGKNAIRVKGCISCHTIDGSRLVGPSFKGLFGKIETVVVNGQEKQVKVDEEYIKRSILNPTAEIVKGYPPAMPPQKGLVTEQDIQDIIAYLKTLK